MFDNLKAVFKTRKNSDPTPSILDTDSSGINTLTPGTSMEYLSGMSDYEKKHSNEASRSNHGNTINHKDQIHASDTHQHDEYNHNIQKEQSEQQRQAQPPSQGQLRFPGLERYKVMEKMGEGAFSVVYKAQDKRTGSFVAVKVLNKFQMDQAQQQAVLKEVTIMRQLLHPNVVLFIEFLQSERFYYIVQELVGGGEIFAAIVNYTYLSENLARHVVYQVAKAVQYLHEEVGIVHRDIKPENLLFEPVEFRPLLNPIAQLRRSDDPATKKDEGEYIPGVGSGGVGAVKLADFGLSKQIWETNTKTPCGTVGYTAPEIVRDQRYSKEVDMWAIGCVLYTLLCGFPPFYDERIEALTEKVARGEYTFLQPWWDEISAGAKHCVSRLLTVDPSRRYTITDLLEDPWLREAAAGFERAEKPRAAPQFKKQARFLSAQALNSPGALALRDAFDISAAVHRQGEEAAYRRTVPTVTEEEESAQSLNSPFALNLGGASILGRRRNKAVPVAVPS